jgi:hypothetical protein
MSYPPAPQLLSALTHDPTRSALAADGDKVYQNALKTTESHQLALNARGHFVNSVRAANATRAANKKGGKKSRRTRHRKSRRTRRHRK